MIHTYMCIVQLIKKYFLVDDTFIWWKNVLGGWLVDCFEKMAAPSVWSVDPHVMKAANQNAIFHLKDTSSQQIIMAHS